VIGVDCGLFAEIEPENRRGAVLVQGLGDSVPCIACHPTLDRLLIGVADGTLQLWDYRSRTLLMVQEQRHDAVSSGGQPASVLARPQTVAFDKQGGALAIGMTSGVVRISDPESLQVREERERKGPLFLREEAPLSSRSRAPPPSRPPSVSLSLSPPAN
jgi:WD40 repeat protein